MIFFIITRKCFTAFYGFKMNYYYWHIYQLRVIGQLFSISSVVSFMEFSTLLFEFTLEIGIFCSYIFTAYFHLSNIFLQFDACFTSYLYEKKEFEDVGSYKYLSLKTNTYSWNAFIFSSNIAALKIIRRRLFIYHVCVFVFK